MLKKINILVLISIFLVIHKSHFFENIYSILKFKYDERISKVYGYCEREGIGYVNFIKKNFKIDKKVDLINSLPPNNNNDAKWAIYNTNFSEKNESGYLIVINHKKISNKVDLSKFKILHNFNDCYFLEKND
jgi:hypothetical protein